MRQLYFTDFPVELQLLKGRHHIWLVGGLSVRLPPDFGIELTRKEDGRALEVKKHWAKVRSVNSVRLFYFQVDSAGTYGLSVHNYHNVVVRKSTLLLGRLLFSRVKLSEVSLLIS